MPNNSWNWSLIQDDLLYIDFLGCPSKLVRNVVKTYNTICKYSAVEFGGEETRNINLKLNIFSLCYFLMTTHSIPFFSRISLLTAFTVMKILLKPLTGCIGSVYFCVSSQALPRVAHCSVWSVHTLCICFWQFSVAAAFPYCTKYQVF